MCHLRMAVMHLPTKFVIIDIFRNPRWRPPPSWIFKSCKFGTFHHVNSVVFELYIKFGSNICYSHWDQHTYAPDSPELLTFLVNSRWRPPPSWIFSLCEFGYSGVLIVRYLCSLPNLVQIYRQLRIQLLYVCLGKLYRRHKKLRNKVNFQPTTIK